MEAISMTHDDSSRGRGDSQMRDIRSGLSTPEYQDSGVNPELISTLELRRVQ